MKTVSIHQPNFLPWPGFFSKISKSDVFVLLDHVKATKNSYINRNRFSSGKSWFWMGIPISKKSYRNSILDITFSGKDLDRHIKYFEMNHLRKSKEPALLMKIYETFRDFSREKSPNLSEFNTELIFLICDALEIKTEIIRSSKIDIDTSKKKQDLLVDIVKSVGGDSYLSGKGAVEYQSSSFFEENLIDLKYNEFFPTSSCIVDGVPVSIIDMFLRTSIKDMRSHYDY